MSDDDSTGVDPQLIRTAGSTAQTLIWGVVWIFLGYYGMRSIQALAGERTFAFIDVTTDIFGISVLDIFWWCALIGVVIWAVIEHSLRKAMQKEGSPSS